MTKTSPYCIVNTIKNKLRYTQGERKTLNKNDNSQKLKCDDRNKGFRKLQRSGKKQNKRIMTVVESRAFFGVDGKITPSK